MSSPFPAAISGGGATSKVMLSLSTSLFGVVKLAVTVTDPKGFLAASGFRSGDLVVAIDGASFRGTEQMQAIIFEALKKDSVKMTVLRDGGRIDLVVDPKRLMGAQANLGGEFEPTSR